jgi:mRNA interferase MazF
MLPAAGDIAWVDFDPIRGTEQAGRRPALVLSSDGYHRRSRRAVVCPITSNERPWPFKVILPPGLKTRGAVLIDQIRTIDTSERLFTIIEKAPDQIVLDVRARLAVLVGIDAIAVIREATS